jgi:transcriptional regulator with XRE-family HTH domain
MDRQTRRKQMRGWLELGEREGLTRRELAERTGVSLKTVYRWAARFRGEREGSRGEEAASAFVEIVEEPERPAGRIEIVVGGDRRVLLCGEVDEESLVRVVRALERC